MTVFTGEADALTAELGIAKELGWETDRRLQLHLRREHSRRGGYVDQRKRLEERIKSLANERRKDLAETVRQANDTASDTRQTVFTITERARLALDETIKSIQADLNRTDLAGMDPDRVEEMRRRWEDQLTEIEGRHRDALMAARDMLASLAENLRSSDGEEPAQIMQAMEERMMALGDQTSQAPCSHDRSSHDSSRRSTMRSGCTQHLATDRQPNLKLNSPSRRLSLKRPR